MHGCHINVFGGYTGHLIGLFTRDDRGLKGMELFPFCDSHGVCRRSNPFYPDRGFGKIPGPFLICQKYGRCTIGNQAAVVKLQGIGNHKGAKRFLKRYLFLHMRQGILTAIKVIFDRDHGQVFFCGSKSRHVRLCYHGVITGETHPKRVFPDSVTPFSHNLRCYGGGNLCHFFRAEDKNDIGKPRRHSHPSHAKRHAAAGTRPFNPEVRLG